MTDKSPGFDHNISLEAENFRNSFYTYSGRDTQFKFSNTAGLAKKQYLFCEKTLLYSHNSYPVF